MIRVHLTAVLGLMLLSGCKDSKSFDDGPGGATPVAKKNMGNTGQEPTTFGNNPAAPANPNSVGGGGGGGGAVQSVRKAVTRTVDRNDLANLNIFIQNASLASGQMPSAQEILAALKQDAGAKKMVEAIEAGDLVLTGIRQREGVWAYPKSSLTSGGPVLTNQGVETLTAQELAQRLKQ